MGKTTEQNKPRLILLSPAPETKPTIEGPAVQPISPASAKAANIAVEALGIFCDAIENAPGHIGATAIPHRQHPIRETTAFPAREAIR